MLVMNGLTILCYMIWVYTMCVRKYIPFRVNKASVLLLGHQLIELGFNDTSTLVGHFVSAPREMEKKDKRDSRGDQKRGTGEKGK